MNENVTQIWREYQAGIDYQQSAGFSTKWPEFERFKSGDQWPTVTEATRDLPRPVLNIIDYLIKNKKSNILAQAVTMAYTPDDLTGATAEKAIQAAKDFTDHAHHTWYDIGQDNLNSLVVEDAATLGAGIWHYFWDTGKTGGTSTKFIGSMAGEIIDPSCLIVGNPQNPDVQTQPYIEIASRDDTEVVKDMLRRQGATKTAVSNIESDTYDSEREIYDGDSEEQDGAKKTTVITKYFRKGGFVFMTKSVKDKIVIEPHWMNGNRRYPVEAFRWRNRKRCFYGASEVEGLIPAQKAINLIYAMLVKCLMNMGFPKMVVYPNALGGKKVTGKIGEILTNHMNNPNAISYLQPPQFNNAAFAVVDNLIGYIRTLSGVTEGLTGERIVSDMAAGAIMAIQAQSRVPLKDTQNNLYRSYTNIGRIWEEFNKNYGTMERPMVLVDDTGKQFSKAFKGSDAKDISFDLKVKVGPASEFDEALSQASLDKFYERGDISIEDYLDVAPPNVVPYADELRRLRVKRAEQSGMLTDMVVRGAVKPEILASMASAGLLPKTIVMESIKTATAQMPPPQPEAPPQQAM